MPRRIENALRVLDGSQAHEQRVDGAMPSAGRALSRRKRVIMGERDPNEWMWNRAAELLERADKVQRRFFHLSQGAQRPCWEPPVDIFESESEIAIVIALPGVEERHVDVSVERGEIVVVARRALPAAFADCAVRRLEIPQGRFERRIVLAPGRYELFDRTLTNGCLSLRIRKII